MNLALLSMSVVVIAGIVTAALSRSDNHERPSAPAVVAEERANEADRPPPPPPEPGYSRQTVTVSGDEQLENALRDFGLGDEAAASLYGLIIQNMGRMSSELRITAELAQTDRGQSQFAWIETSRPDGAGVRILAAGKGYKVQTLPAQLTTRVLAARGEMADTLYSSAIEAGIDDSVISEMAGAFAYDVDFQFELRPGNIFEAAYEQDFNRWNQPVGRPRLLFASLRLRTRLLQFYRFKTAGNYGWFDANGHSNRRSLMRTPVDGARVTSRFGFRMHPIQHFWKMHSGTDFAAPTGTPVYAAGDGTIMVAAPRGGAGNMIALRHDNGWITHYFHLSRFGPGITSGTRVTQGQRIGDVGTTGNSTGPHLHYELVVDGKKVNPMKVETGTGIVLAGEELSRFRRARDRTDAARARRSGAGQEQAAL